MEVTIMVDDEDVKKIQILGFIHPQNATDKQKAECEYLKDLYGSIVCKIVMER